METPTVRFYRFRVCGPHGVSWSPYWTASTPIEAYVRERAYRFTYGYAPALLVRVEVA